MTGFARLQKPMYAWEMRSVNHRGIEVRLKVPEPLWVLENSLRVHTRNFFSRGYIEIMFREQVPDQIESSDTSKIDPSLLSAIEEVCHVLPSQNIVSVLDVSRILQNPHLHRARLASEDRDLDEVEASFLLCLDQLRESRQREGRALQRVVQESVANARRLLAEIGKRSTSQPDLIHDRLLARLSELDGQVDASRVAQEVAILAQKFDIKEEFDRLEIHLNDVDQCLNSPKSVGRRLNFLTQEILREANTLGAKTQDPASATLIVDLKVCVDEMREQVQNVE